MITGGLLRLLSLHCWILGIPGTIMRKSVEELCTLVSRKNVHHHCATPSFQGNTPWVAPACADCPGFLVLGSAPAPASTLVSEPQIVPLS